MTQETALLNELNRIVGGLQTAVTQLTTQWRDQDNKAACGRQVLYEKVEQMRTEMVQLNLRVGTIREELNDAKESVKTFSSLHQQAIGSKKILVIVGTAVVTVLSGFAMLAAEALRYILPKIWPGFPHQ